MSEPMTIREALLYIEELEENCNSFPEQLDNAQEIIEDLKAQEKVLISSLERAEYLRSVAEHEKDGCEYSRGQLYDQLIEKEKEIKELRETVARLRGGTP